MLNAQRLPLCLPPFPSCATCRCLVLNPLGACHAHAHPMRTPLWTGVCPVQSTTLKNVMCLKNAKITALLTLVVLVGARAHACAPKRPHILMGVPTVENAVPTCPAIACEHVTHPPLLSFPGCRSLFGSSAPSFGAYLCRLLLCVPLAWSSPVPVTTLPPTPCPLRPPAPSHLLVCSGFTYKKCK